MAAWYKNATPTTRRVYPFVSPGRRAEYVFEPGVPVLVQPAHMPAILALPRGVLVECSAPSPEPVPEPVPEHQADAPVIDDGPKPQRRRRGS